MDDVTNVTNVTSGASVDLGEGSTGAAEQPATPQASQAAPGNTPGPTIEDQLASLAGRVAALEQSKPPASQEAVDDLTKRVAQLESSNQQSTQPDAMGELGKLREQLHDAGIRLLD